MAKSFQQKRYLGLFVFFFIVGIIWGRFFYYSERSPSSLFPKKELSLLIPKGFASVFLLEDSSHSVRVIEYSDIKDLIEKIWDEPIDLVVFRSFEAEDITDLLADLDRHQLRNLDLVSVDFKNLSFDPGNKTTIPLFWGIEKEQSRLWIESIGIIQSSKNKAEAHAFIDYFLEPDVAIQAVKIRKAASTNRAVEELSSLQPKLKPSYIRKVPIKNLSFQAGIAN